jgi:hypothetical protein
VDIFIELSWLAPLNQLNSTHLIHCPSMQGPINDIYQHNDLYKLNWDNVVNSANNNRSVTDPDLFTIRRCRIWWHSIQKRFGNLVFHEAVWDSITGKSQSALQSTQVFKRLYRTDTRSCKPTPTPCQQTRPQGSLSPSTTYHCKHNFW